VRYGIGGSSFWVTADVGPQAPEELIKNLKRLRKEDEVLVITGNDGTRVVIPARNVICVEVQS